MYPVPYILINANKGVENVNISGNFIVFEQESIGGIKNHKFVILISVNRDNQLK